MAILAPVLGILTLLAGVTPNANERLLLLNASALVKARHEYQTAPEALSPPVQDVLKKAKEALTAPLVSVMDKEEVPPSGDKHDYMSLGPYWWPDPSKSDGLPYIRRDGEVNPEVRRYGDNERMDGMVDHIQALALAYAMTDDERFAGKAIDQVERWFVDPATRMNPNLNYGQAIKGVVEGRGIGIIETYQFRFLLDALILLQGSKSWTTAIDSGMNAWLTSYLIWMQESPNGKDEAGWKNNHGSAYDVQVACMALYLGQEDLARRVVSEVLTKRIAVQVLPDGSQPLELERTKSWGYSNMNLEALVELAHVGRRVGIDLWNASTPDGRSIRSALNFLLPYALGERTWTWTLLTPLDPARLFYTVTMAAEHMNDPAFRQAARHRSIAAGRHSHRFFFVPAP